MVLTRQASRTRSDRSVGLFVLPSGEDILPASSRRARPRPRPRLRHGVERSEDEYHPPSLVPQSRARRVYSLLQRARRRRSRALRRVGRGEELCRVVLVPLRRLVPRGDERLRLRCSFPPPATSTVVKTTISIFARTISRRNPTWSLSAAIATTAAIFVARGKTSRVVAVAAAADSGVCAPSATNHQPESFPETITSKHPGDSARSSPRRTCSSSTATARLRLDPPARPPPARKNATTASARRAFSRWCGPNRDMRTPDITRS